MMSYDIGFLVDMYTGLYETEELAEGALATVRLYEKEFRKNNDLAK